MTTMTSIDVLPRRVVYGKYDEREAFRSASAIHQLQ
jgi:hypothetical protein